MKMRKITVCLGLILSLVLTSTGIAWAGGSFPNEQAAKSIRKALNYLYSIQNQDGGFPSKAGSASSRASTSWVIMALRAAGEDVTSSTWAPSGKDPVDYLLNCQDPIKETCDYARLLLALSAANRGSQYKGIDLADKIASFQQASGQFAQPAQGEKGMINSHIWSMLALASTGQEIPNKEKAKQWLLDRQNEDGGFAWLEGVQSDADDTGVAVQALVLLGEDPKSSPAVKNALNYLKRCQEEDGGFNCGDAWMASGANAASDAWVLQGLLAAGEDPVSSKWSFNGKNAVTHLLSLQNSDGSFNWKTGVTSSPVTMTAYAIMALAQKPFPVNLNNCANEYRPLLKGTFPDVSPTYWAYHPIMNLVEAKVLAGYSDGTFKPDKSVSRAEFAKFMVYGLGLQRLECNSGQRFTDLPANYWANRVISIAVHKGYIKGKPGGVFDPNGKITGAELASILVRALPPEKTTQITAGPCWYSGSVKLARENGLLYPNFQADLSATRAQCAYSIVQLRNLLGQE